MRRLVISNQWCAYLWIDIANHAVTIYDEVVLLTGQISELNTPLSKSVSVEFIPPYVRRSLLTRWVSWLRGFVSVVWRLRTQYRNYEVLLSTNPPLATWVPLFVPNKCSLYVMDLYPEALLMTGMVAKRNPAYWIWRKMNKAAYQRFARTWVITHGMKDALEKLQAPRIDVIPLWSANTTKPADTDIAENAFLVRHNLSGKFLVVYSGNLGKEHDIEVLIEVAKRLRRRESIQFLIIGQGWKYDEIQKEVKNSELGNVLMLPFQDAATFQLVLAAAGLGVVAQSERTASVCIPSKTMNLLASEIPILAIASLESELAKLIANHKCGITVCPEQPDAAADFIYRLANEPGLVGMYRRAAKEAARHFSADNAKRLIDGVYAANA